MRLILVEGIPGSGKTSACEFIGEKLRGKGVPCNVYMEGDLDHPADYEGAAFLNPSRFEEIKNLFPSLKEFQYEQPLSGEAGMIIPYEKLRRSGSISDDCAEALAKYDVYEMPAGIYKRLILTKWRKFAEGLSVSKSIVIADCCFLQNPLTILQAKYNEPPAAIMDFVFQIQQTILIHNPLLIYMKPVTAREIIVSVKENRPAEWFQHVSDYYTRQEFGKAHGLKAGLEGVVKLLEERMKVEQEIITRLSLRKAVIPILQADRGNVNKALDELLQNELITPRFEIGLNENQPADGERNHH